MDVLVEVEVLVLVLVVVVVVLLVLVLVEVVDQVRVTSMTASNSDILRILNDYHV